MGKPGGKSEGKSGKSGGEPAGASGPYILLDFGLGDFGLGDFGLGDVGSGERLEQWGDAVLVRPDIRASGPRALAADAWERADAIFEGRLGGSGVGGGRWRPGRLRSSAPALPDRWPIEHAGLRFSVGCAPSGHTGLFPEQAAHWAWMAETLRRRTPESIPPTTPESSVGPEVLNLFAYTGGASVALAAAGARVTHVDASRPTIGWARENAALNGISTIRWIHEDARRFVDRERRRGRRYDALLLDPPAFGRGPAGDWQLDRDLGGLLEAAVALLRPDPAFVVVNVYSGSSVASTVEGLLGWALDSCEATAALTTEGGTLWLPAADGRELATGVYARARSIRRVDRG
jgi:23S rRNA (cytosine1962-C5)-methyltransferase